MRLTKAIRKQIADAVIYKMYDKVFAAAQKELREQVGTLYDIIYAEHIAAVELLPESVKREIVTVNQASIYIQDNGNRLLYFDRIGASLGTKNFPFPRMYRFGPMRSSYSYESAMDITLLKTSHLPAYTAFYKALSTLRAIAEESTAFKQQINSILNSCTTDKRLLQIAPELAEFIPKPETSTTQNLPLPVDMINSVRSILQGIQK